MSYVPRETHWENSRVGPTNSLQLIVRDQLHSITNTINQTAQIRPCRQQVLNFESEVNHVLKSETKRERDIHPNSSKESAETHLPCLGSSSRVSPADFYGRSVLYGPCCWLVTVSLRLSLCQRIFPIHSLAVQPVCLSIYLSFYSSLAPKWVGKKRSMKISLVKVPIVSQWITNTSTKRQFTSRN